jgi:hypothetical protein
MSLFFEPIPHKEIGNLFKGVDGAMWVNGTTMYEYIVPIDNLDRNTRYYVSETPLDRMLRREFDDLLDDDDVFKDYLDAKFKLKEINGEVGYTRDALLKVSSRFNKGILDNYKNAVANPNSKESLTMYAADVPHVIICVANGIVNYESVNTVVIGGKKTMGVKKNW